MAIGIGIVRVDWKTTKSSSTIMISASTVIPLEGRANPDKKTANSSFQKDSAMKSKEIKKYH